MAAPPAGARPADSSAAARQHQTWPKSPAVCAICEPGGGPKGGVLSGWMVTLVNESAGAAALPPPACSARELVGRASAEGSSARGRKPKVGPSRVRGWLRTSRVSSGGASVDADTFWPPRPAATEAAAGCMPSLQDCSWPRRCVLQMRCRGRMPSCSPARPAAFRALQCQRVLHTQVTREIAVERALILHVEQRRRL